jgi:cytoskeletal protein RodZ
MSTVAQQLQQGREARNLTIQQVAEITKIRTDHVRALEEGNYDAFSAPVYIRGFVRTYATLLKLDVPQVMGTLDGELKQTDKFAEPPSLSPHSGGFVDLMMLQFSKLDWRKALIGLAAVALGALLVMGYFTWKHHRAQPYKGLKPATYQAPQNGSANTLPVPAPQKR